MKIKLTMSTNSQTGEGQDLKPSNDNTYGKKDAEWKPINCYIYDDEQEGLSKAINAQGTNLTADNVLEIVNAIHAFLYDLSNREELTRLFIDRFHAAPSKDFDVEITEEPPVDDMNLVQHLANMRWEQHEDPPSYEESEAQHRQSTSSSTPPSYEQSQEEYDKAKQEYDKAKQEYEKLPITITRNAKSSQWQWGKFPFRVKERSFEPGDRKACENCTAIKLEIAIDGVNLRGFEAVQKALLMDDERLLRLTERIDVYKRVLMKWPFFADYLKEGIIFERMSGCSNEWKTPEAFLRERIIEKTMEYFAALHTELQKRDVRDRLDAFIQNIQQGLQRSTRNLDSSSRTDSKEITFSGREQSYTSIPPEMQCTITRTNMLHEKYPESISVNVAKTQTTEDETVKYEDQQALREAAERILKERKKEREKESRKYNMLRKKYQSCDMSTRHKNCPFIKEDGAICNHEIKDSMQFPDKIVFLPCAHLMFKAENQDISMQ